MPVRPSHNTTPSATPSFEHTPAMVEASGLNATSKTSPSATVNVLPLPVAGPGRPED